MSLSAWRLRDIPDLVGRTAVVTGGNVGLGFRSALELARSGATVLVACRSLDKGEAAAERIRAEVPARIDGVALDLTKPASIEQCAGEIGSCIERLDLLLNNAGVVNLETLRRTLAGHELHMATNHYGHFMLTGHLFPLLAATPGASVVTVASAAWRSGTIDFDDLDCRKRPYSRDRSYGDSKLANLLFMRALLTLRRRSNLGPVTGRPSGADRDRAPAVGRSRRGVRPPDCLAGRARRAPAALGRHGPRGGQARGPWSPFRLRGPACWVSVGAKAVDDALAERIRRVTEGLTGVRYPVSLVG